MGISISRWIGAGLLAFGVVIAPTALLSGTGVAYADTGTESDGGKPASQDPPGPREPPSPDATGPDDAVQVLTQAWISDWFDGTHTDAYYGERGETITIATPAGPAQAYVIPGPAPKLNFFDRILRAMLGSTELLAQFNGNCAADPAVTPNTAESLPLGRNSTGDTALSLDGRRQTGQSVFQQCRRS